jgi:hypothetical protein
MADFNLAGGKTELSLPRGESSDADARSLYRLASHL